MAVSTKSWLIIVQQSYDLVHIRLLCKEYVTLLQKKFSLVFCCNFWTLQQKPHVVAAKICYLKNVRFLLGHPVNAVFLILELWKVLENYSRGPGKVLNFLSVKEWEPWDCDRQMNGQTDRHLCCSSISACIACYATRLVMRETKSFLVSYLVSNFNRILYS